MKNSKHTKSAFLLVAFGAAVLLGTSSFTGPNNDVRPRMTVSSYKTDAQFLSQAAQINLDEIQLGQLAQKKSMMKDVKELGQLMEKNHKQALIDVKALASKKGIALPTAVTTEQKEKYKALSSDSEKKFNDEYCELMIRGHKEAIELFEAASKDSKDADIRQWATTTLPTLRTHLEHSKMCKEKCEKM